MKTLQFTLTNNWFKVHLSGKSEEYREITPYWTQRLFRSLSNDHLSHYYAKRACDFILKNGRPPAYVRYRSFDTATGHLGYSKTVFVKKYLGLEIGIGEAKWGAPEHPVFIIKLGNIIETKNI